MRRLAWLGITVLALAACAPALLAPRIEREGELYDVTVVAQGAAYSVTVTILNAVTNDPRCAVIQQDLGCVLGDIPAGERQVVTVEGRGAVDCVAFGFSNPDHGIASYRPYPCGGGK